MSDLRDFLNWFEGFADNIDETPNAKQWDKVKARIAGLKDAVAAAPASAVVAKPAAPAPVRKQDIVYPFIIDAEGYARNGRTKQRVLAREVTDTVFDLRGLDGDMKSIVWADDSTGLNGANCNIVAV